MRELLGRVDDEKAIVQLAHHLAAEGKQGEAIDALASCELDAYLQTLAEIAPLFGGEEDAQPVVILRQAAAIAGWARPDWREVYVVLKEAEREIQR